MATLPQFKQRQILRRNLSDIDRLASQYKKNVEAMTGEYQNAFSTYQAGVSEKMKPFEEQITQYTKTVMPEYEAAAAAYKTKLDEYNAQLEEINKNPVIPRTGTMTWKEPRFGLFGLLGYTTKSKQFEYYEPKPIPTFTEKMPDMPNAPTAPSIESFDSTAFDQKREQVQSEFSRELGERKAAKMGAVSRRASRPMLQGAQA